MPPPCSRWRRCPCLGSCKVEEPFGKFVSALLWGSQSQDLGLRGKGKVTNRCRDAFMCQACASEIRNLVESAELHGPPLSFCTHPPHPLPSYFLSSPPQTRSLQLPSTEDLLGARRQAEPGHARFHLISVPNFFARPVPLLSAFCR